MPLNEINYNNEEAKFFAPKFVDRQRKENFASYFFERTWDKIFF